MRPDLPHPTHGLHQRTRLGASSSSDSEFSISMRRTESSTVATTRYCARKRSCSTINRPCCLLRIEKARAKTWVWGCMQLFTQELLFIRRKILCYESTKRELKTRPINECRCDERLKSQAEESTRLTYTGLIGGKIKTRLIDEKFASVMGECVI
jgi:hypothetical protein